MGFWVKDRFKEYRGELRTTKKETEVEDKLIAAIRAKITEKVKVEEEARRLDSDLEILKGELQELDRKAKELRGKYENYDRTVDIQILNLVENHRQLDHQFQRDEEHYKGFLETEIDHDDPSHADIVMGATEEARRAAEKSKKKLDGFNRLYPQVRRYRDECTRLFKESNAASGEANKKATELERMEEKITYINRRIRALESDIYSLSNKLFREEFVRERQVVGIDKTLSVMETAMQSGRK